MSEEKIAGGFIITARSQWVTEPDKFSDGGRREVHLYVGVASRHGSASDGHGQLCLALGMNPRSGSWFVVKEVHHGIVWSSVKAAKLVLARSAWLRRLATEKRIRFVVKIVKPRERGRWLSYFDIGDEVWPNPVDPVAAIGAIR